MIKTFRVVLSTLLLIVALVFVDATTAFAQGRGRGPRPVNNPYRPASHRLEISPFWGYQFGGRTSTSKGDIYIVDSENYGIQVSVMTPIGASVEFLYSHQPSTLKRKTTRPFEPPITEKLFNIDADYYMLGVVRSIQNGKVSPFGAAYMGVGSFIPQKSGYTTENLFAVAFGGGAKIRFNDKVGLRLQGRLLMPIQWAGGGLWCGTGGCDIGLGANSTILQLDLNAGLVIYL